MTLPEEREADRARVGGAGAGPLSLYTKPGRCFTTPAAAAAVDRLVTEKEGHPKSEVTGSGERRLTDDDEEDGGGGRQGMPLLLLPVPLSSLLPTPGWHCGCCC